MDLNNILSISGRPGLFELIAQTNVGVVAISLIDGKKVVTSDSQQINILSEIQIYCKGKKIELIEVFEKILNHEGGKTSNIKPKAHPMDFHTYFLGIIEDYDTNRVYPSDIKKIIQWYNILLQTKKIKLKKLKIKNKPVIKKKNLL